MPASVRLTLYIVSAILVFSGLLFWILYQPVKRFLLRHRQAELFYDKVSAVTRNGDFLLINKPGIEEGNPDVAIDHILAGDKFIYVITDCFIEGGLRGKASDSYWLVYERGGKKRLITNPLAINDYSMNRLSAASGINCLYMVGVVLLNDDCVLSRYKDPDNGARLVKASQLEAFIARQEAKDVGRFNPEQLEQAMRELKALSLQTHESRK
jgi:hypothetical protein